MKKIIAIVGAVVILVVGVFVVKNLTAKDTIEGGKKITITIEDQTGNAVDTLYKGSIDTDAEYLGDVLNDLVKKGEITMDSSSSEYGMFINSFNEIDRSDINAYWMFSSDNNAACAEAGGYCPLSADQLPVADGDAFLFYLSNEY